MFLSSLCNYFSSLSAAITCIVYIWLFHKIPSLQHFGFSCICGTFHWLPFTMIAYATMLENDPSSPFSFALLVSILHRLLGLWCYPLLSHFHFYPLSFKTQDKEECTCRNLASTSDHCFLPVEICQVSLWNRIPGPANRLTLEKKNIFFS